MVNNVRKRNMTKDVDSNMRNGTSAYRQGFWYLFAGGSAALLELILFQCLYAVLGVDVAISNIISVVIATIYNFFFNRTVAFRSASNPFRSAVLYGILFLLNLTITTCAISAMVAAGVHSVLAKIIMQACVVCWNFVLYRKVIFR